MIGDGFCNDETNNAYCNFDGWDCCTNPITNHCTECKCFYQEYCKAGFLHSIVGDGNCNDETNNAACNFDGNDCCRNPIITDFCVNCTCIDGELKTWHLNMLIVC